MSALLAGLAAALAWAGFAGVGCWPLAWVAFIPLFAALDRAGRRGGRRVLGLAWLFGTALWGACCSWLLGTLERFAGLTWPAALGVLVLFSAAHGGLYALFGWLWWRARRRGASAALAAAAAIAACEWVYPRLFPGYYGASLHALVPVVQIAELGGPLALSALCLAVNGALYEARTRRVVAAVTALGVVLVLGFGVVRVRGLDAALTRAPRLRVGIVQPDMGGLEKWTRPEEGLRRLIEGTRSLGLSAAPELVVWPENAVVTGLPAGAEELPPGLAVGTPLLFGAVARRRIGAETLGSNRVLLADADGRIVGRYAKVELLPFGETMPLAAWLPALAGVVPARGRMEPGPGPTPLAFGAWRIAALVCVEDALPGYVRRVMRETEPQLLVNLTNDAWFGDGPGPWIHFALAKLRAVEERRSLVRATNTGVSAVIDPVGRVIARVPAFEQATLAAEVPLFEGTTLYRRFGDWPGWLGAAGILWLAFLRQEGGSGRERAQTLAPPTS